ncbi:MAG: LamG domain-containing protein, partial [bacterium]|nr:LamG domain-containing protein [bacterium]
SPVDVTFDNVSVREVQSAGTINGALIKDESTAESVPKQTQNLPSGASKKSMAFDGTDDFVDTGFQPDFIHTNATMAYWVNMDDFVSTQLCGTHNGKRFYLGVYNATAGMGVQDQNNLGSGADVSGLMAVNQWHHLAMVADGGTATFYLDGVARDTLSYTQNSANNPSANLYIGGVSNSGSAQDFMNASIDEFAVWDTALDGDAVKALYNAGLPTPVATKTGAYDIYRDNLKAHYRMGDATNPAADGTSSRVNTHLFDQTNPGLGTEPLVADPYTSQKWALGSGNTATFVAGESVRIDRPATGGDGSAGYSYITDDAEGILTEDLVATKVYKFTLLFETDDSDAVVRVYGDGGIYQSSAGSGVKTFYLFGHGGGTYMTFGNIDNGKFVKVSQLSVKPVNGNTGTISGATIQTESPKAIYALPPLSDNNRSLILDGTNDHLVTQVDKTAQPNNESRYYSFWLKSTTTSRYAVFDHGTHQIGALQFNDSNKPILYMSTSSYQMWNDNSAQDDGNWHHWVVKIKYNDITGCELWCDGVKQTKSTTVNTGSMNTYTTGLRIGISGSFYLNGSIDEFSIHEELDEEAIRALYNRGRPIDISSNHGAYDQSDELLHWWRMGDAPVGQLGSSGDVLFQGLRFEGDEMFPTNASSSDWASLNNMTWDGTTLSYAGTGGEQATAQYTFTLPVGQTFRLTVDIENDGTGNFFGRIGDGSNSLSLTNVTTGTYEVVHTVTESGANNTLFFIVNSSFSGTISNISLNRIRGQYIGPELFKADADLYQASTWTSYGDNVETFPNGTAVRFT